jgi:hypothetical protein
LFLFFKKEVFFSEEKKQKTFARLVGESPETLRLLGSVFGAEFQ